MRKSACLLLVLLTNMLTLYAQEAQKGQNQSVRHFEIRAIGGYQWSDNWSKQTVMGGNIEVSDNAIVGGDVSYYFSENFSVQVGISTSRNELILKDANLSSLSFSDDITDLSYGHVWATPVSIGVCYHRHILTKALSFYGGADFSYTLFNHRVAGAYVKDVTFSNVKGFDLKIGADYELPFGLFVDFECKKGWEDRCNLDVDLSNYIDDHHLPAQIQRKPLTLQLGIGYRF